MLVKKTFFDKCNTISYGSSYNSGSNPIGALIYGQGIYNRFLFHFDESDLVDLYTGKTCPDISKFKHYIKIYNSASLHKENAGKDIYNKIRAVDINIIVFPLFQDFTEGIGHDYMNDGFGFSSTQYDTNGSNWYKATNTSYWNYGNGTYSGITSAITIATQNLPTGTEAIYLDITNYVNNILLSGITNYGLCLALPQELELINNLDTEKYIGFFTNKTNTIFHPSLISIYDNTIDDDRALFYLNKSNKLYFYSNNAFEASNLDFLPSCNIVDSNGNNIAYFSAVTQETKGVYSIPLTITGSTDDGNDMFYDTWGNIVINGVKFPDVEMSFTTKPYNKYFGLGLNDNRNKKYNISVINIGNNEHILIGEKRKVNVLARIPYTVAQTEIINGFEYRIYTMEGKTEITMIDYTKIEKAYNENYFILDTTSFTQGYYHLDIRLTNGYNVTHFKDVVSFYLIDNVKNIIM